MLELDTSNDLLIAQLLQQDYEDNFNHELRLREKVQNQGSKETDGVSDSDHSVFSEDSNEYQIRSFCEFYYVESPNSTKHDLIVSGYKNASKFMKAPISIDTGDCQSAGMKLSNHVYNNLAKNCIKIDKRRNRIHENKETSIAEHSMDAKTRLILYKMINKGLLVQVNGCISTGKEACIFHAELNPFYNAQDESELEPNHLEPSDENENNQTENLSMELSQNENSVQDSTELGFKVSSEDSKEKHEKRVSFNPITQVQLIEKVSPDDNIKEKGLVNECAIKIYKTVLTDFKNRQEYMMGDHKFSAHKTKVHLSSQKLVQNWAEKETSNLRKMKRYGLPVPDVIALQKHVLVMTFIGKEGIPAPKLKDSNLSHDQLTIAYEQIIKIMKKLFNRCHLIHADLSAYNILWHENQCYIIDVGQSVSLYHPKALEFLYRDCVNFVQFFEKAKLEQVHTPAQLFNAITGFNLANDRSVDFIHQIRKFAKHDLYKRLICLDECNNESFEYLMDRLSVSSE